MEGARSASTFAICFNTKTQLYALQNPLIQRKVTLILLSELCVNPSHAYALMHRSCCVEDCRIFHCNIQLQPL